MRQWLSAVAVTAVVCAAAACSSGSGSPTSPSLPSAAAASPAAQYGAVPSGATIQGTVTAQAAAAARMGVHALGSAGVKVSVTGMPLSTTSDDSGRFSLGGVPAGPVDLHFEAPGVDAHLEIEHVAEGETLEIEVHVSGSQATMGHGADDAKPETEVSFTGSIGSLSPFTVAGRSVVTNGSTRILDHKDNPIAFSALKVGDAVEVEGTSQSDGSVVAKKIKLDD